MDEHKEKLEKAREQAKKEARKEKRDEIIREIHATTDFSYSDLADMDWVGVTRGHISQIVNSA